MIVMQTHKVRWTGALMHALWFTDNRIDVQHYDAVRHTNANDWRLVKEIGIVLSHAGGTIDILQGAKYVTGSLVFPCVSNLIANVDPATKLFDPVTKQPLHMSPTTAAARSAFHADLVDRWYVLLDERILEDIVVSTLLDPRFRRIESQRGFREWNNDSLTKEVCMGWLSTAFEADWKSSASGPSQAPVARTVAPAPSKRPRMDLGSLLGGLDEAPIIQLDELERYFAMPSVPFNTDVLAWWKAHGNSFPANLEKMARQFLAHPATSASVERLFSKAGKLHDDQKKSTKEDSIGHALMASINYK
jgi:hypothetical protein